ncbi:MAG: prephenate dehydrogenase/arogenate dehydrogenase family protein [Gammaproteobacteria bacterium]|nr:prephenate dehydrogenase/arogenate dehydrogenase family protein [Gammaproteobacteria bacterium]
MSQASINQICIIGVGLIGGSLARALRQAGFCQEIIGGGRSSDNLKQAVALGVVDRFQTDLAKAVADADMVVLAVPVGAIKPVLSAIKDKMKPNVILTDVGSTKASVIADVKAILGHVPSGFVPGHPIAGTEKSGVAAAIADLYKDRRVILTPLSETDRNSTDLVRAMWECTGAEVSEMSAEHHDEVLAATSHLPHLLAFSLVDTLAQMDEQTEIFKFAAGGFRDFTRIASSDPVMWHDICLANHDAIMKILDRFTTDLDELKSALNNSDSSKILEIFKRARAARDRYTQSEQ